MATKKRTWLFSIAYFLLTVAVIWIQMLHISSMENILKPLLLIVLMIWYGTDQLVSKIKIDGIFMFALFFSLLGDIFLMPLFDQFIFGLVFFLISHLFYISVFVKGNGKIFLPTLKNGKLFLIQVLGSYAALVFILLFAISKLDSIVLLIAIPVYATVLLFMLISTYVYSKVHFYNFGRFILLGGLFFFISDSILAINKFVLDIPFSSIWVMGIYTLAQWMLVYGYMNSRRRVRSF